MQTLVTTDWLAEHLGDPDLVVFDATLYLPQDGKNAAHEFRGGHIPGARFFDIDSIADPDTDLPHMVPSPGRFAKCVGSLGVGNDSLVVFYDQNGTGFSARGWWMMGLFGHDRAALLDGGLPKWRHEGRPIATGEPIPAEEKKFLPAFRAERLRGVGDMLANVKSGAALVLDARGAARFHAKVPESRPGLRSGHIPGSRNLPYTELLAPDGTLLPAEKLRARFAEAGVDGSRPVITSCGSGVSATVLTLAMVRAGFPAGAVYDGSWTEWGGRADTPGGDLTLMPDDAVPPRADAAGAEHRFDTRLAHAGRAGTRAYGFVNPAVHRGSTVLYPDTATRKAVGQKRHDQVLNYGMLGGPTHYALEDVVAEIEGGTRCQIVSSGLAAVTTSLLASLKAGEHCLMPDSVYGPTRVFCKGMLAGLGIETTYYHPCIDPGGLSALLRPNTKVLFLESPGSHTFEVQDVPALAAAAHRHGAKVLLDNTWGIHFFQPFRHGVDVSIQALTKYAAGHSDVLLGGITTNSDADWHRVRAAALALGQYASPDDCWLALRGARTMGVRLRHQMAAGIEVATWLSVRPEVRQVLYPALPGAPGHDLWKRDFTGACSLFGVVFDPGFSAHAVDRMAESLALFGMGDSWGGFESLAMPSGVTRTAGSGDFGGAMMRLHIGLEDTRDLIADLEQGFGVLRHTMEA